MLEMRVLGRVLGTPGIYSLFSFKILQALIPPMSEVASHLLASPGGVLISAVANTSTAGKMICRPNCATRTIQLAHKSGQSTNRHGSLHNLGNKHAFQSPSEIRLARERLLGIALRRDAQQRPLLAAS